MTAFGKISTEDYRKTLSVRKIRIEAESAVDHRFYKSSASVRSLNNFSFSSTITPASVDSSLICTLDTNSIRRSSLLSTQNGFIGYHDCCVTVTVANVAIVALNVVMVISLYLELMVPAVVTVFIGRR